MSGDSFGGREPRKSPSEAMEKLMRGEITTAEYVAVVKHRTREMLDRHERSRQRQDAQVRVIRSRLANARRILRKWTRP